MTSAGVEFGAWVPVAERLPEEGQAVVLYRPLAHLTQDPDICIGWNTGRKNESPQGVKHTFDCWCHPTHWLPLPVTPNVVIQGPPAGGPAGMEGSTS